MKILAVDTTSEFLDMALSDGNRVWQKRVRAAGCQDEKLFAVLEALLKNAKWRLKDIELLAAASGPGSFTGIRVGMTFVSMLARTLGKPAVGVSLLEAAAFAEGASKELTAVALIAPRDEIFFQVFDGVGEAFGEPRWVHPSQWPAVFKKETSGRSCVLVGTAARSSLRHFPARPKNLMKAADTPPPRAADLIGPAIRRKNRESVDSFGPLYLRPAYYERGGAKPAAA